MIKRKLWNSLFLTTTMGIFSCIIPGVTLTATMNQATDKIAKQCLPYLQQYGDAGKIPAKIAKEASPILALCITQSSCQNSVLSDIKSCAHKLSNLSLSAQVENIKQQVSTKKKTGDDAQDETQSITVPSVVATPAQPETINTQAPQQPVSGADQQKPTKKKAINWF